MTDLTTLYRDMHADADQDDSNNLPRGIIVGIIFAFPMWVWIGVCVAWLAGW